MGRARRTVRGTTRFWPIRNTTRLVIRAGLGPLRWHVVPARARPSYFFNFLVYILEATLLV
jgi:hypothetical protein